MEVAETGCGKIEKEKSIRELWASNESFISTSEDEARGLRPYDGRGEGTWLLRKGAQGGP